MYTSVLVLKHTGHDYVYCSMEYSKNRPLLPTWNKFELENIRMKFFFNQNVKILLNEKIENKISPNSKTFSRSITHDKCFWEKGVSTSNVFLNISF